MSKNSNSVFFGVHTYNWRAPHLKINAFFRGCKMIIERARNGYARHDLWDFDSYLTVMFSKAFEELALNHYGYPHGMTDEEWTDILHEIASCFRDYNPETSSYQNEYEEAYFKEITEYRDVEELKAFINGKNTEVTEKFLEREKEIDGYRKERLKRGLELFSKYFENFWD